MQYTIKTTGNCMTAPQVVSLTRWPNSSHACDEACAWSSWLTCCTISRTINKEKEAEMLRFGLESKHFDVFWPCAHTKAPSTLIFIFSTHSVFVLPETYTLSLLQRLLPCTVNVLARYAMGKCYNSHFFAHATAIQAGNISDLNRGASLFAN